jgi:TPR repeat protein
MLLALAAATPLSAQTVKGGIDAWQQADYTRAVAIWRPLAEKGDPDAQFDLGEAYRLGRGVAINLGAATVWFERAAKQGHVDAQRVLGLLLFQNGDRANGLKWLKAASDKNDPGAMLIYGTALVNGDGIGRDPVLGYSYVSRAAATGLAPAKETLADLDRILSPEQRKKGAALAMAQAKPAGPAREKAARGASAKPLALAKANIPKAPAAPPAKPAPAAATPARGGWRIQLGAFSQRLSAEALYRKLSGNSALAGRGPFYIPVGAVTRLQVGPFESKAAAESACRAVATACFPVPAK